MENHWVSDKNTMTRFVYRRNDKKGYGADMQNIALRYLSAITGFLLPLVLALIMMLSGCAGTQGQSNGDLANANNILADPGADKKKALDAFVAACKNGNTYGCFKVGVAYNKGVYEVPVNIGEAINWYLKAAEKGFIPAQQNIANLYAYRQVEPMNDIEGYKWLELAMRATARCEVENIAPDNNISTKELNRLCVLAKQGQLRIQSVFRKRMKFGDIAKSEELANSWIKKY